MNGPACNSDEPRDVGERWPDSAEPWTDDEREQLAGWPTTRSYSRTLYGSQGAFPRTVQYADPIERPALDFRGAWFVYLLVAAAAVVASWFVPMEWF